MYQTKENKTALSLDLRANKIELLNTKKQDEKDN
jgi:hypothetical protein